MQSSFAAIAAMLLSAAAGCGTAGSLQDGGCGSLLAAGGSLEAGSSFGRCITGVVPAAFGPPACVPADHRPTSVACCSNLVEPPTGATCAADSDCAIDSGYEKLVCLNKKCSADRCVTDGDCPAGSTCSCWSGGYGSTHYNTCVPSGCVTDADCPAGLCVPTIGGFCNRFSLGNHCWKPSDECVANTMCNGGACQYDPTLGHWACEPVTPCSG